MGGLGDDVDVSCAEVSGMMLVDCKVHECDEFLG